MDLNPTQLKFAPIEIIWQESNGRFVLWFFLKKGKIFQRCNFILEIFNCWF